MKYLLRFRYLFIIAVLFMFLSSMFFIFMGAEHCIHGMMAIFTEDYEGLEKVRPGVKILEGLDMFMAAMVFMIFGLGIGQLFFFKQEENQEVPAWLRVKDLMQLKMLLWETILVTMVVFNLSLIIKGNLDSWNMLILPLIILILSVALFFLRFKKNDSH